MVASRLDRNGSEKQMKDQPGVFKQSWIVRGRTASAYTILDKMWVAKIEVTITPHCLVVEGDHRLTLKFH